VAQYRRLKGRIEQGLMKGGDNMSNATIESNTV